ncbi:glutamate receptor 2.7-like [Mercurialis annua]|uniref:glutamate receptor 2.7-like n=1 Tax=Mercurialis annua TaxID=3986 RepID=UPI0024ADEC8E|nr:glutamate receptor 2.7-like [Mercurialis annua]
MSKKAWRNVFLFNFLLPAILLPAQTATAQRLSSTVPVNIGVVLDMDDWAGKIALSCINMSLSDFYANHSANYKTRLVIQPRNSGKQVVGAAAADLIKIMEVQAIVGPTTSMQVDFVVHLGEKAQVPIISFSASSTSIHSPYFFRATLKDSYQAQAITDIIQAFGWKAAVPIYADDVFGEGIIPHLTNSLQEYGIHIPYWSAVSPSANDHQIVEELYNVMSKQITVFIVHMFPTLGSRVLAKAKEVGMFGAGYVWILTDSMTDALSSSDPSVIGLLQGVLGVKPFIPKSKEMDNFRVRWKKKFLQDNPDEVDAELNINGLLAYDAVTALAMAVENAGMTNLGYERENVSSTRDLESLGVSRNGPDLVQVLSNISFQGLTGKFHFVNGQLDSSLLCYQVVNVNGDGARGVGFWTAQKGLARSLDSLNTTARSASKKDLAHIIWPGDSVSVPKGWDVAPKGKKLRIGVPVKEGFREFIHWERIPDTNTFTFSGFCIELFEAAVNLLPYNLPFEYIPADISNGSYGAYDDLVFQVYVGAFDAAVGDISILSSRSYYVEYTLPYLEEGGFSMIVPMEDHNSRKTWVFLKPLTWGVWVTSICFFIFIGFVIWVLEHRVNEDLQGTTSHQISISFWFSFSAMVLSSWENVMSNLARMVVIIWCFVGLVLTQSYAAALSSFLTVRQLQPTVNNLNELIYRRDNVGYQRGSFIFGLLKSLGFSGSQLVPYGSAEECDQLLSKGSKYGGIAAAFDEAAYINIIQTQTCPKYTVVEPRLDSQQFISSVFGFVFPKGSVLSSDISMAILKLKESNKIKELENKWFVTRTNCTVGSEPISSRLGLDSFSGLFLIAGIALVLVLLTYVGMIAYERRDVF